MATARIRNAANGETAVHKVPATALAARRGTAVGNAASNVHEMAVRHGGGADELRDRHAGRLCHVRPDRNCPAGAGGKSGWHKSLLTPAACARGCGAHPGLVRATARGGRVSRAAAADGGVLGQSESAGPYEVDLTSWWQVARQPGSVLDWEQAHLPGQFSPAGGSVGPSRVRDREFSLPPVPGVLYERTMVVTVVAAGGGQTAIRVDGWVIWIAGEAGADGYRLRPGSSRPKSCRKRARGRRAAHWSSPHHRPRPGAADHLVHDGLPLEQPQVPTAAAFSRRIQVTFVARIGGRR